jgi:hypothetical protein
VALLACTLGGPVQAAVDCQFRPDAPDQHKVVKRDTLWDISGAFLEHPWCWPQVWGLNRDEIHNPHWIYPGQIVYFDRKHGRLSLNKPGADEGAGGEPSLRLSPQLRSEALGNDAVPAIPAAAIEPFLTQPLLVEAADLADAPRIVASQDGHLYLGKGDRIYVRGELKGVSAFQVFRRGNALTDPQTGRVLAHEAAYLGTVSLASAAHGDSDVHTFTVTASNQEIGVGDLLLPVPPAPVPNYVPHLPPRQVDARLMSIYSGMSYAGQSQAVTVNRGSLDGLDVGSVLQLYHFGQTVRDRTAAGGWFGSSKSTMKLPDEQYGSLFIFRVFKHVSYGLIMQVKEPAQVGDAARSPE